MYRTALSAIHDAGVSTPYGWHHWAAVVPEWADVGLGSPVARPNRRPDRALIAR
jgi:hypothetical protein